MAPQDQAELWMALRDRMTVDWHELTMQEKKACKFQASGNIFSPFFCLKVVGFTA